MDAYPLESLDGGGLDSGGRTGEVDLKLSTKC